MHASHSATEKSAGESPTCSDLFVSRKESLDSGMAKATSLMRVTSTVKVQPTPETVQSPSSFHNFLGLGDNVQEVVSTTASPMPCDLGFVSGDSGAPNSSLAHHSSSEDPRDGDALHALLSNTNPVTAMNRVYLQILRRHQMAHCNAQQVMHRIDAMPHDALSGFTRSLVDVIETFFDHCEEVVAQSKKSQVRKYSIIGSGALNNADSGVLNSSESGAPPLQGLAGLHSAHAANSATTPDPFSSVTPLDTGGRDSHRHLGLEFAQNFASFASFMTTASTRSMDRLPIHETTQLKKSQDTEGNKTINRYSVVADLGRGAYGKVKLGVNNETNESVAIKIIKKSIIKKSSDPMALRREIAILKKVRHQNVVSLYEVIDDPDSDKLYLIMQYVSNGPLVRIKNDFTCAPLPEAMVKTYLRQLISAARYLHKRHIIHHDIKPDNILLGSDGQLYLTDFGVSEMFSAEAAVDLAESTRRGGLGTPMFQAPELLDIHAVATSGMSSIGSTLSPDQIESHQESSTSTTFGRDRSMSVTFDGIASDTWAIGVTTYLILVGRVPFSGRDYHSVVNAILHDPIEWTGVNASGIALDPRWKDVILGMLERDPRKRWTLKRVKNHPIFIPNDVGENGLTEADVIGDMQFTKSGAAASKVIALTPSELMAATTTIGNFLNDDDRAPVFTPHVSGLARNYVSRLRLRVSHKSSSSQPNADDSPGRLEVCTFGAECESNTSQDYPPSDGHSGGGESPPVVVTCPSPPKHAADGSPNPRRQVSIMESVSPGGGSAAEEEEPNPCALAFEDIFSIRRPTVVDGACPSARPPIKGTSGGRRVASKASGLPAHTHIL